MATSITKKLHKPRRYLDKDYQPHENDVLIGRGRMVETHNKKFRALISAHLTAYYNAQTKATKSTIILRIFQHVKRGGGIGFIKREASSRRFFVVEDAAARISIAQAFRDALSSEYKSSKQYKQQKRKEERGEATLGQMMSMPSLPLSSQDMSVSLVPPRLVPVVSSDGRDISPRSALQNILERAATVVTALDVDAESMLRNAPEAATDVNVFAGLEQAIGADMDLSSNPFEPTPIKESRSLLLGDGDADLMDSITSSSFQKQDDEDAFRVFDTLPTLDIRHALGA